MPTKELFAGYVRNFVFGVEDGVVSTVGLLSGIAAAGVARREIIVTGAILILVEAFSMAVGSFLAERSAEEYAAESNMPLRYPAMDGLIMFVSYLAAGFLPLAPYVWLDVNVAVPVSVALSLVALFGLGLASAKISRTGFWRGAVRMLVIGGIAVAVGVLTGKWIE